MKTKINNLENTLNIKKYLECFFDRNYKTNVFKSLDLIT